MSDAHGAGPDEPSPDGVPPDGVPPDRAPPDDLDLARTIRPGLDILGNTIVIALKRRARFAVNAAVYAPGLVRGSPGTTLLEHALGGVERLHAELGRYTFAAQDAFTDVAGVEPVIVREMPASPVAPMPSGLGPRLLAFHREWVGAVCRPGEEPATYGETVTADVDALLAIMERVNLGKPVAESKFREHREALVATGGEREPMLAYIVRPEREAEVLARAERLAERYDLPPAPVRRAFEFMIGATVDLEVEYLRRRIAGGAS